MGSKVLSINEQVSQVKGIFMGYSKAKIFNAINASNLHLAELYKRWRVQRELHEKDVELDAGIRPCIRSV
jgi:hypothetical protein